MVKLMNYQMAILTVYSLKLNATNTNKCYINVFKWVYEECIAFNQICSGL